MENFIVSARKYRPATFDTVVGQAHITNTLKNAIKTNQLAQAFLFCGPRGVGKTTCARILAKTINCQNLSADTEACDTCESCVSFKNGASMNIHELDAASNNSVDDIRSLVDQVRYAPQSGKKKIYIIDEVHMLSQSAFNAFLKTLEEPPPYAIFILATTEKHKIIPTILSRCQIFDFNRIQVNDISKHLEGICKKENITFEAQALHVIAQKADGALRDALSIFDQVVSFAGGSLSYKAAIDNLNILDYDYYFKLCNSLLKEDSAAALVLFDEILDKGFDGNNFIVGLAEHFRNLLVCKDERTLSLLEVSDDVKEKYLYQAGQSSPSFLLSGLNIASQCDVQYKMSKNQRLHVELCLLKLSHLQAALNLQSPASMDAVKKKLSSVSPASTTQASSPATPIVVAPPADPALATRSTPVLPTNTEKPLAAAAPTAIPPAQPKTEIKPASKSSIQLPKFDTLAANLNKAQEEQGGEEGSENLPKDHFSPESFHAAWKQYAEQLKQAGKTNLYILLSHQEPALNGLEVQVNVENKVQKDQLLEEKTELMSFVRKQLNNFSIELTIIEAVLEDSRPKLYTATDRFKHLAQKNPSLMDLKKRLDLDLEF